MHWSIFNNQAPFLQIPVVVYVLNREQLNPFLKVSDDKLFENGIDELHEGLNLRAGT